MILVQQGDLEKMGVLFDRYHRDLFGFFYRLTNDGSQSEDLAQNTFYRMLKYRNSFNPEGKFVYWLYTVARNIWKDQFRKSDPLRKPEEMEKLSKISVNERNAQEQMDASDSVQTLRLAMQQISDDKREAIVLSKFHGMKYKEIAQMSNVSENAIKARIHRGLLELKEIIQKAESV